MVRPLRKKAKPHKMRAAKVEKLMKAPRRVGGGKRVPLGWRMSLSSCEKQLSFHGKPSPWVIRFTMSSPDVVPMSEDSQRNKENPRSFCLVCFVLVSVKF